MGMYDNYHPDAVYLRLNRLPEDGWQGKNAYRLLDDWDQGEALPRILREHPGLMGKVRPRLPDVFYITSGAYTLRCFCEAGIWSRCELTDEGTVSEAEIHGRSPEHEKSWEPEGDDE